MLLLVDERPLRVAIWIHGGRPLRSALWSRHLYQVREGEAVALDLNG